MNSEVQDAPQAELESSSEMTNSQEENFETPEQSGSDQAPEEKKEEKVSFTPEQQKTFDEAIAKKVKNQREAERRAKELEVRNAELEAKLPKEQRPNIPEMPDPFDDDYDERIKKRETALIEATKYDEREAARKDAVQRKAFSEQQAQKEKLVNDAKSYASKGKEAGLSMEELQHSANEIQAAGVDIAVQQSILADSDGPLIADYLAKNPNALDEMASMTAFQAGAYLETNVRPNVAVVNRKTNAPSPPTTLNGGGNTPKKRGAEGASFE